MVPELGHFAAILALLLALAQFVLPLVGVHLRNGALMQSAGSLAFGQFVFVSIAFACLLHAYVTDDFTVRNVASNSNTLLPIYYKISAAWGNHEGSFLLWCLITAGWTVAVAIFSRDLPADMLARVLAVMGGLASGFLAFLLFTSNPFERLLPNAPAEGSDLNPLLQDFGLIVHPPMLYMGYVGFAVAFAFAVAALMSGRLDAAWARWSRPWTNIAWAFLTLGITLGSWWAYYELGWGGWWFWDPVENASFMPWLLGTALIHSLAVSEKRGVFKSWTVLLAICAFSLSLLGAFIVRSGVLTSVHAFAVDPQRGMFILMLLLLVVGGSLTLYAVRAPTITGSAGFRLVSREVGLLANNVVLIVATAIVLIGTLTPLVYEAVTGGDKLSVGPPYYNLLFNLVMAPLFVLLAIGPLLRWKQTPVSHLVRELRLPAAFAVVAGTIWAALFMPEFNWGPWLAAMIALWIVAALAVDWRAQVRNRSEGRLAALFRRPLGYHGMQLAHLGIAVTIIGVSLTSYYSLEKDVRLAPGEVFDAGPVQVQLETVQRVPGPNYVADRGQLRISDEDGNFLFRLAPEKRRYLASGQVMTEAAIRPGLFSDTYVALGEPLDGGAWSVRVHYKPFVRWVWLGGVLMTIGGALATFDKRYRRRRVAADERVGSSGAAERPGAAGQPA